MFKTLFAVYLGGKAENCNIELHDVVFVIGNSIEETYSLLVKKWFGIKGKVHIDSYIPLTQADGYKIGLSSKPSKDDLKLFFLNFGAYTENLFGEVHESAFYVAKDRPEALKKARESLCVGMIQPHLDDTVDVEENLKQEFGKFDVDDVIEVSEVDGYHLQFTPVPNRETSKAIPGYQTLKHVLSSQ